MLLTACQPESAPTILSAEGTLTRPDLVGLIEWNRSPTAVVFRAQKTGGDAVDFLRLGDIPDCTIYGDNTMVYLLPAPGGGTLVAVDKVTDESIRTFIEDLTLNYQLFNQTAGTVDIATELLPPHYETLFIAINGQQFTFDSLGGWVSDYYTRVLERCRAISVTPAEFVPESGAWVTIRSIPYDPNQPAVIWDAIASSVDLTTMADKDRQWLRGRGSVTLWDVLRAGGRDIQLQQGDNTYQVAIQVPGITLNAPAAP
jgi:hypothetical protein